MFDRISRSFALAGQCWDVLKQDPALLIFPVLSSAALLMVLGSFAVPVFALFHSLRPVTDEYSTTHSSRLLFYIVIYGFYVVSYTIMMFFNSALIGVALKRLDGESASVVEGLQMAMAKLPAILGYAVIAATVGMFLRWIEERVGLIGRFVVALIGAGWTVATAMTLPVLIEENVGPTEAIARSVELLRGNWGENLIGNGGISFGVTVIALPVIGLAFLLMSYALKTNSAGTIVFAGAVFVVAIVGVGIVSTTLHSIYTAALYRYAIGEKGNAGIDGDLLEGAYRQK